MPRDFTKVWRAYSDYNETNTIMVSNFSNLDSAFKRNDLIVPEFQLGEDDRCMAQTFDYLKAIQG